MYGPLQVGQRNYGPRRSWFFIDSKEWRNTSTVDHNISYINFWSVTFQFHAQTGRQTHGQTPVTRSSATAKSTARPSCLVGVVYDISGEKVCWWLISHFYLIATKATEFGEITQNNGHYAVQCHSRSPILVPIESPYTTSYYILILTYLLPCKVSKLGPIIGQLFAIDVGVPPFNFLAGVIPCEYPDNLYYPETRRTVLPDAENRTIVSSFVWTKHRTNRRTDRQTDRQPITAVGIASNADAL